MDEGGEEVDDGRLLSSAGGAGRDEHGDIFVRERALRPKLAGRVEERLCAHPSAYIPGTGEGRTDLELRGHIAEARGDTEEEGVKLGEVGGLDDGIGGLGRGVQLLEDVLRERLGDLVDGRCAARCLDAALHGLGDCAYIQVRAHTWAH